METSLSQRFVRTIGLATLTIALGASATALAPALARADAGPRVLRVLRWPEFEARGIPLPGEIVAGPDGRKDRLRVRNTTGLPKTFRLAVIDTPGVAADRYEVRGQVRYTKLAKQAYLEMWSVFGDGQQYFSRTLADEGPMARLVGNSAGREISLPFDATGAAGPPTRLILQLVLTSNGAIDLGPLELVESP